MAVICAFDIDAKGHPTRIDENWPSAVAGKDMVYRWLHFDLSDPEFSDWVDANLPQAVAQTLVQKETRPRCDALEDGMILNLRGVNLNPGANPDDMVSVRLWVAKDLIVSARIRKIWVVDAIRQEMETGIAPPSVNAFLVALTAGLSHRIEKVSLELKEDTDDVEERSMTEHAHVSTQLIVLRQSVIKLRRYIRPQTEALSELASGRFWKLDKQSAIQLRETMNQSKRTLEELDATADRLKSVQDHLDIMQAKALGRNSYVLSVIAAIFLPLGFLTGLFGINVGGMPGVGSNLGFWVVSIGCVVVGLLLFFVFRLLKWL